MKKYLGLLVVFLIILVTTLAISNVAKAEDETSSDTGSAKTDLKERRKEIENEIKDKRDELKTQLKTKKEELKVKREEVGKQIKVAREEAKQKMEDLKEKVKEEKNATKAKIKELRIIGREEALKRLDAAVLRIDNLKNRINAQIVKLEARGIAVTEAKDFVATAETKLNEARAKIVEANKLFSASSDELTTENKINLRTLTKEIQTLIVVSHKALNNAVRSLRDSIKAMLEDLKNATKTNNNNDDGENNSGNRNNE